jgi:hypothetical protein
MDMDEKTLNTADMYLAALLLSSDFSLIDVNRSDPKHIRFCFSSCDGTEEPVLEDVVREYTNGTMMVNASRYVESIRKIKSLIHAS